MARVAQKKALPPDIRLRARGFKIYARPKTGLTLWERNGKTFWESAALEIAEREEQAMAAAIKECSA